MNIMPVTKERLLKVWWSHLWRLAIAILCAQLMMAFFGLIAMVFIIKLPMDSAITKYIAYAMHPVSIVLYMIYSIIPMSQIIGKDYKGFRLVLISEDKPQSNSNI